MRVYRIEYRHHDMPKDYISRVEKFARDEREAVSYICKGKPDKSGLCITKKGAQITILSVTEA